MIYHLGDPEFHSSEDLGQYLDNLQGVVDNHYKSSVFKIPFLGRIAKWFYDVVDKPVFSIAGDFIGKDVQARNLKSAYESLEDKLSGEGLAEAYADELFINEYAGIFSALENFADKNDTQFVFVLGNNDLSYTLFKPRFDKLGLKRVKFIDREVVSVYGNYIAGFGGSPEFSNTLGMASGVLDDDEFEVYQRLVSSTNGFSEAAKNLDFRKVDALLVHKAYNSLDGQLLWGSKRNFQSISAEFIPTIDDLISKFSPDVVLSGHSHAPDCVVSNGITYVNSGIRGVASSYSRIPSRNCELLVKPYGDLSGQQIGGINSQLSQYFGVKPKSPKSSSDDIGAKLINAFSSFPDDLKQQIIALPQDQQGKAIIGLLLNQLPEAEQQRIASLAPNQQLAAILG